MGVTTTIAWCDATINPWIGCQKVSEACAHCYAEATDARFRYGGRTNWGASAPRFLRVDKAISELEAIARRSDREGRPRRVFIASMADVFEDRPDLVEPRKRLWDALHRLDGRLVPLLLTKRPEHMASWATEHGWLTGAWAGTTVETQARAYLRIPHLLRVPARVRFVSCEPILEPMVLRPWLGPMRMVLGTHRPMPQRDLHWVIVGGESGPKARATGLGYIRDLVAGCRNSGTPVFVKQLGARVLSGGSLPDRLRDPKGADPSEWPEDLRVREIPD